MTNNIEELSREVIDNFDKIAEALEIEYTDYDTRITMPCPVHGGDGDACVIYKTGRSCIGNWQCFSHQCESSFGISIVGFLRGALEYKLGCEQSYGDVLKFVKRTLNIALGPGQSFKKDEYGLNKFARYFQESQPPAQVLPISRLTGLKIPSQYYIKRGFSKETLIKYHVGFCNTKGKPFYLRTVVPVLDDMGENAVGFLGRTINEECPSCGWYHYTNYSCPKTKLEKYFASKWINSRGFQKSNYLYNSWLAKQAIEDSKTAILTEGVGDVWRLTECGIKNCLSMFGCKLNEKQVAILDGLGVQRLIVALDNDAAGREGRDYIDENYRRYFNIKYITPTQKDIGDMSCLEVKQLLGK